MTQSDDRFLSLLEEHRKILYKVANAYCREREDRADLAQEMVIQLWRSFGRYDERFRFSTWMYRIALNVAISFYRTESVRIRQTLPLEGPILDFAAADQQPDADDRRVLYTLIGALEELDRALILLYLDGYAHQEIGEVLGLTPTNVATRIDRLKRGLKQRYEEMER
jgi:RNA polymerase sigma-70 factor (ECF subfamily)